MAAPTHGSVEAHNARAPRKAASDAESVVSYTERRRRLDILQLEQQVLEGQQRVLMGQLAVAKAVQEDSRSGSQVGSVGRRINDVQSGSDDDLLGPLIDVVTASAPPTFTGQPPTQNFFEGVFGAAPEVSLPKGETPPLLTPYSTQRRPDAVAER